MIKIETTHPNQNGINQLNKWIISEWGEISPIAKQLRDEYLPLPILAYEDDTIVGGLRFDYFQKSKSEEKSLWINALYVKPSNRRQGIARMLIQKAKDVSKMANYNELFVYTKFPELYLNSGWELIETKKSDNTLRILLK